MKRLLFIPLSVLAVLLVIGVALAQLHGSHGGGLHGAIMGGGMGHGGPSGHFQGSAAEVTEEKARELAQQYAEQYLAGFKVEQILPSTGMGHTMYWVELKNSDGEFRSLHITPFGGVMPFSDPGRGHRS